MSEDHENGLSREEIEVRLTALALGEVSPEEAADLLLRLESDPELVDWYSTVQQTGALIGEALSEGVMALEAGQAPSRLSADRRESLLEAFRSPASAGISEVSGGPSKPVGWRIPWYIPIGIAAGIVVVLSFYLFMEPEVVAGRTIRKGTELASVELRRAAAPVVEKQLIVPPEAAAVEMPDALNRSEVAANLAFDSASTATATLSVAGDVVDSERDFAGTKPESRGFSFGRGLAEQESLERFYYKPQPAAVSPPSVGFDVKLNDLSREIGKSENAPTALARQSDAKQTALSLSLGAKVERAELADAPQPSGPAAGGQVGELPALQLGERPEGRAGILAGSSTVRSRRLTESNGAFFNRGTLPSEPVLKERTAANFGAIPSELTTELVNPTDAPQVEPLGLGGQGVDRYALFADKRSLVVQQPERSKQFAGQQIPDLQGESKDGERLKRRAVAKKDIEAISEILVEESPSSTFSLNVSDVSFRMAQASLGRGMLPDPGSVRVEEFINAFDYHEPEPPPGAELGVTWQRAQYPFAQQREVLRVAVRTAAQGRDAGRPLNLVILLDNSGSMERADRVAIVRASLRVLSGMLGERDRISVVAFARVPHLWVDGLRGGDPEALLNRLLELVPEGGTNLEAALELAYETAGKHSVPGGNNRVVLLTDGAANLGDVNPEHLRARVEGFRKRGVALDCFGIGWEGYNDTLLEQLSRNGDGRYGFVNDVRDADTGFARRLAGALQVAASDVKVQVEFNPDRVVSFRLIGYTNHQLQEKQFRDAGVDAAELGAAESGNALYLLELKQSGIGPLCTVRVRFKRPVTGEFVEREWNVPYSAAGSLEESEPSLRLAVAASAFGEWLSRSPYAAGVRPDQVLGLLRGVPEALPFDPEPRLLESMIRQAGAITGE